LRRRAADRIGNSSRVTVETVHLKCFLRLLFDVFTHSESFQADLDFLFFGKTRARPP
jgi:hypothetical protein